MMLAVDVVALLFFFVLSLVLVDGLKDVEETGQLKKTLTTSQIRIVFLQQI